VLAERESRLSALQRLALVDAAASWLAEPNGGDQLAYALLGTACTADVTTEHVHLVLMHGQGDVRPERVRLWLAHKTPRSN
jgi:hypothetical protein